MKIVHAAIYVRDLQKTKHFFETYFDARANEGYHNPKTDFHSYFLTFEQGCQLEIMNKPGVANSACQDEQIGYAHLAFSVGSKERVDELTKRLGRDGFYTLSGPRTTGDGYYESCVAAVENIRIEITV